MEVMYEPAFIMVHPIIKMIYTGSEITSYVVQVENIETGMSVTSSLGPDARGFTGTGLSPQTMYRLANHMFIIEHIILIVLPCLD